nr:MAG TPA: Protein of unknown function (DUF1367) [Caudoviricetes sp.]
MALEITVAKTEKGELLPLTEYDEAVKGSLKTGKAYKVKITEQSNRSLQHHRLFFGGLLPFAFQYWQPSGGMVGANERDVTQWVIRHMARQAGANEAVMQRYADEALDELAAKRAEKFGQPATDIEQFRKWLTIEAGYFDVYETPNGYRKEAKSISFHSMGQEEFNRFYRDCFQVAWNMMLSSKFESEEAAERAAMEMMEMGG